MYDVLNLVPADESEQPGDFVFASHRRPVPFANASILVAVGHDQADRQVAGDDLPRCGGGVKHALEPSICFFPASALAALPRLAIQRVRAALCVRRSSANTSRRAVRLRKISGTSPRPMRIGVCSRNAVNVRAERGVLIVTRIALERCQMLCSVSIRGRRTSRSRLGSGRSQWYIRDGDRGTRSAFARPWTSPGSRDSSRRSHQAMASGSGPSA